MKSNQAYTATSSRAGTSRSFSPYDTRAPFTDEDDSPSSELEFKQEREKDSIAGGPKESPAAVPRPCVPESEYPLLSLAVLGARPFVHGASSPMASGEYSDLSPLKSHT